VKKNWFSTLCFFKFQLVPTLHPGAVPAEMKQKSGGFWGAIFGGGRKKDDGEGGGGSAPPPVPHFGEQLK
jgi:hypothetical protein